MKERRTEEIKQVYGIMEKDATKPLKCDPVFTAQGFVNWLLKSFSLKLSANKISACHFLSRKSYLSCPNFLHEEI